MTYVRNAWYVACWSHDLAPEKPHAMTIMDEAIVLWRTSSGAIHALEDRCVHRHAPLSLGRCEGERLRCMYHGLLFESDGRVAEIPGQDTIPPGARVRRYAVVERHSWVWVWMGDADAAEPDFIPPAVGLDDPDYVLGHGLLDYAAEARLINDNLLDFSHLTFVHAESFGSGPQFAATPARFETLERGIRYARWTENTVGSVSRKSKEPMDNYMTYDFLIPGVLLMTGGVFPLGTAKALDHGPPDLSQAVSGVTFTSQAVTPMTKDTARYFFSWGPHRKHGGEQMRDMLMEIAGRAFAEDKAMIEAQHRNIARAPDRRVMPTAHDRGVTIFNRMVTKMVRDEGEA